MGALTMTKASKGRLQRRNKIEPFDLPSDFADDYNNGHLIFHRRLLERIETGENFYDVVNAMCRMYPYVMPTSIASSIYSVMFPNGKWKGPL
jgi:hypothetical protein